MSSLQQSTNAFDALPIRQAVFRQTFPAIASQMGMKNRTVSSILARSVFPESQCAVNKMPDKIEKKK